MPRPTVLLAALLALCVPAAARASDKPSAVQLCFEGLDRATPLFADRAQRNYRKHGQGYLLDLDLLFDGKLAPERITQHGASCLRAWLAPRSISSVTVNFDRLDLNLPAQTRQVKLKLKADVWHDGGSFTVTPAAFSGLTTPLPGKLQAVRLESAEWSPGGELVVADPSRLPAGRYRFQLEPPAPPRHPCETIVEADATGSIRPDNQPVRFQELIDDYRKRIAPKVLSAAKQSCEAHEVIELRIRVREGIIPDAWEPKIRKISKPPPPPAYSLSVDGKSAPFPPGTVVEVGYGQRLILELAR